MLAPRRRRRVIVASIVAISLVLVLTIANTLLSSWLQRKVSPSLAANNISYSSLDVSLVRRSVTLKGVRWQKDSTSLHSDQAHVTTLSLRGIGLVELLADKTIDARTLLVEDGAVAMSIDKSDSTRDRPPLKSLFRSIRLRRVVINNMECKLHRDSVQLFGCNTNLVITNLRLDTLSNWNDPGAYSARNIQLQLGKPSWLAAADLYLLRADELRFDQGARQLTIDCLYVEPLKDKYAFAKSLGRQTTRTQVAVPSIKVNDLTVSKQGGDTTLTIGLIEIEEPKVTAFKDKRVPFRRDHNIQLPMAYFQELPWVIEIDTIKVRDGLIIYEEFAEDGLKPGAMFFSDVDAVFGGFVNRDYTQEKYATINASSALMGKGRLNATFLMPLKTGLGYQATASLSSMSLGAMNDMLEHVTFTRVESGTLKNLQMTFNYNDTNSKGKLEITYEDLKLQSLKKNSVETVNQLKTVLVNAAVRNNMTQSGDIDIQRDRRRHVFNVWAQSALDGIKSAVVPKAAKRADKKAGGSR